jgi:pimeloyl-ACP methyl ester carboxylesterase
VSPGAPQNRASFLSRAHHCVTDFGYTVAAIDAPGHGDRPRTAEDEQVRADIQQAVAAGQTERFKSISVRYGISLAQRAVPEWQATLDALQNLPEIGAEALALFDAFAAKEKTLHANPGDHRTVRWFGIDDSFLVRHLGRPGTSAA